MFNKLLGLFVKSFLVFVLLILGLGFLVSKGSRQTSPERVIGTPPVVVSASTPKALVPDSPIEVPSSELAQPTESLPKEEPTHANIHQVASLFDSAINLERMGKKLGAIEMYARAYMRFPGSTGATRAAEEIRRLGGEVPSEAQVKEFQDQQRVREIRDAAAVVVHVEKRSRQEEIRLQRAAALAEARARALAAQVSNSSGTYTGPRGGVYHYSKNGNKVYEKR